MKYTVSLLVVTAALIWTFFLVRDNPGDIWGNVTIEGNEIHFSRDMSGVVVSK